MTAPRLRHRMRRWAKLAQVAVSPHRLRHTLATQLVNQGMPLASVGTLLGHRSLSSTQHYARLFENTVKTQFESATAHIEGIAAVDWPRLTQKEDQPIEQIIDSV